MCAAVVMIARAERAKTYDFLEGLDDDQFGGIRTQILGMVPFPTLKEAKNIIANNMFKEDAKTDDLVDPIITIENVKDTKTELVNPTIEEVFEKLQCTRDGLTSKEATRRLKIFGPNRLDGDKKKKKSLKSLACLIVIGKSGDVGPKCMVLRDYTWKESKAAKLVPGDIIRIKCGDIVPADARLLQGQGDSIMVNQYVLTRESLPVTRGSGDLVFCGSTCKQGEAEAIVLATGVHTFFGNPTSNVGHFH